MIRSVKGLKRLISARASGDEVERDEDGRAVIELIIRFFGGDSPRNQRRGRAIPGRKRDALFAQGAHLY